MKTAIAVGVSMLMSFQIMASGSALINGKEIKTQLDFHTELAKQLNFSKTYGKNLDSLYYALITGSENQNIIKIKHLSILKSKLGADNVEALIQIILDASQDNPKVVLLVE